MVIDFSIIVVGYNIEQYVERCLTSIVNQKTEACEVIFVDDGSVDATKERVKKIFSNYEHGRYIYQKNRGANAARKTGLLNASGKYISFIDGDDWIEQSYFDSLKKEILRNVDADIISYRYQRVWDSGQKVIAEEENQIFDCEGLEYLNAILDTRYSHVLWDKVYKREFLMYAGFDRIPDITLGDDLAAQVLLGSKKPNVKGCDKVLYNYYVRTTSASKMFSEKSIEIIKALDYMEEVLKKEGMFDQYVELMHYHYFRSFLFYVVRNRFPGNKIQKYIYDNYVKQNIRIRQNPYIRQYMAGKTSEYCLCYIYLWNYKWGCYLAKIYCSVILKVKGRT